MEVEVKKEKWYSLSPLSCMTHLETPSPDRKHSRRGGGEGEEEGRKGRERNESDEDERGRERNGEEGTVQKGMEEVPVAFTSHSL